MNSRICVCIGEKAADQALEMAKSAEKSADVIEIRLDLLDSNDIAPFVETVSTPLLITNRAVWEGGGFSGDETSRVDPLIAAMGMGVAYIDLEISAPSTSWDRVQHKRKQSQTKIISSWHNFEETPPEGNLLEILELMKKAGADIAKIITTANTPDDVIKLLNLQRAADELHLPLICFSMGEIGAISRVATTFVGGYMTYCAADGSLGTAPGQLTVSAMRAIYESMGLTYED